MRLTTTFFALAAAACAGPALAQVPTAAPPACAAAACRLALKASLPETVLFRGMVNGDAEAGKASSMTYQLPAGSGMAGLFTAIATHGALAENSRQSAITKAQAAADAVLAPYQEVLDKFTARELMARAMEALPQASRDRLAAGGDSVTVESAPVFTMAQDQTALVLDNAVTVRGAAGGDPVYQTVVRVVSDAQPPKDAQAAWLAGGGLKLKDESVLMYAHSLHVLLRALDAPPAGDAPAAQQTFRYMEGLTRKVERAHLVEQGCGRAVLKTLRGWALSVPQPLPQPSGAGASADKPDDAPAACKASTRYTL